jgi:NAD(P)H-dependent FMN reductase
MSPRLNIIIGSTRPGRVGPVIADWFAAFAREHGSFEPVLVDLLDFKLPVYDEPNHPRLRQYTKSHTEAWSRSVDQADAYVFVTPEYNYFPPPALINAIDLVYHEWACKPAGILSYGGASGGMRSAQMLKLMLTSVRVMPLPDSVAIHNFRAAIDGAGAFTPAEAAHGAARTMLDELLRWAEALKSLRVR